MAWLSRVALVAPLLLAAGHAFHPDSPESLAWRLWEDLMEVPKDTEMLWIRGNWLVVSSIFHFQPYLGMIIKN